MTHSFFRTATRHWLIAQGTPQRKLITHPLTVVDYLAGSAPVTQRAEHACVPIVANNICPKLTAIHIVNHGEDTRSHAVEVGEEHVLGVLRTAVEFVSDFVNPQVDEERVGKRPGPLAYVVQADFPVVHVLDGGGVGGGCAGDQVSTDWSCRCRRRRRSGA